MSRTKFTICRDYYYCSLSRGNHDRYHATYCVLKFKNISRESTNKSLRSINFSISVSRSKRK